MKEQILELYSQGKSYREISSIVGCSLSTISYHCGQGQKEKKSKRQRDMRQKQHPYYMKMETFKTNRKVGIYTGNYISSLKSRLRSKLQRFTKGDKIMDKSLNLDSIIEKLTENPVCYLTGQKIDINDTSSYHFDHIIPRSRGGKNTLDNLGVCTKTANQAKSDMTAEEFIEFCKLVVKHNS